MRESWQLIKYQKSKRFAPWVPAVSVPDKREHCLMLTEALKIGMTVVMSKHVYIFDGKMHHQQSGGSIGLELTGNIAQVFMIWWDCAFKSRLSDTGILVRLNKRYVDNINMAAD